MWSSGSSFLMSSANCVNESPLHSIAQYIEDYMDLVENVPNDIARQITQLHEHNHRYHQLLAQLESTLGLVCNKANNDLRKKSSLLKIQRNLIEIQEIADEKLLLIQSILDQLDGKARQLDFDYRSVTYNSSSSVTNNSRVQLQTALTNNYHNNQRSDANNNTANGSNGNATTTTTTTTNSNNNSATNESVVKEVNGNSNGGANDSSGSASHSGKRASARRNTGSRGNNDSDNAKRSVKRGLKSSHKEMKRSRNSSVSNSMMMGNGSPSGIYEGAPIDPDEPTYCLCDQVSFGEMICCDNADCKIEWFHFSCVSLNTKPKGKWFCPNCRGDRSNIQKK